MSWGELGEWGLLGSNMSAHDKLKAPRESSLFVRELQAAIKESTGRQVEVLVMVMALTKTRAPVFMNWLTTACVWDD